MLPGTISRVAGRGWAEPARAIKKNSAIAARKGRTATGLRYPRPCVQRRSQGTIAQSSNAAPKELAINTG